MEKGQLKGVRIKSKSNYEKTNVYGLDRFKQLIQTVPITNKIIWH